MKKLEPLLGLINTVLLQQLEIHLGSRGDQALGVTTRTSSIALKTEEAEGLVIQDIRFSVEHLQLPHPGDLNLYVTILLERVDLDIDGSFWPRAAKVAKNPLVAKLGILLDRVEVRNLRVRVALSPAKIADIHVTMESAQVRLRNQLMKEVTGVDLEVNHFDLTEKNKKKAMAAAQIRLGGLNLRLMEMFLNRLLDVVRNKIPAKAKITELDIAMIDANLRISLKTGFLFFSIAPELQFSTANNLICITILKLLGPARYLIMPLIKSKSSGKPGVSVQGDNIWIDPFLKMPFKLDAALQQFCIRDGALWVAFAPLQRAVAALPPPHEVEDEQPQPEDSQEEEVTVADA